MQQSYDPVVARFTFSPDRASEFLDEGRLVTQIDCDTIEEVMEYVSEFGDAIVDANVIVEGKAINLSDFTETGNDL